MVKRPEPRLVSLLLAFRESTLFFRAALGDFVAEDDDVTFFLVPEDPASFDVVVVVVVVLLFTALVLGLAFAARWNFGENCGEASGGERGRADCTPTSMLDCSETGEVGSKTELEDLKSAGMTSSSPPLPMLLFDVRGVAILFSFLSTSASKDSMLIFILFIGDSEARLLMGASVPGM